MDSSTLERVTKSIARTTRYPLELLTAGADLENDLGIDSVKRLEIVLDLGEEFKLQLDREPRDQSIRTIQEVAVWVAEVANRKNLVTTSRSDGPTATPVPTPVIAKASFVNSHSTETYAPVVETTLASASFVNPRAYVETPPQRNGLNGSDFKRQGFHSTLPETTSVHLDRSRLATTASAGRPLSGKVALITGSGHSVGQTVARQLAMKGATVIINSFHSRERGEQTASEINAMGCAAVHLWGSVANPQHVDEIFEQIQSRFGRLDILICNASDGRIGKFMDLESEDWDRAFRTNVVGHHQCAVRASSLMRSHGGGSIVTMSAVGSHGYIDGLGSQGVVKAAVETMTRYLACELGQFGIRVNCIVGGPIYGELLSKFPNSQAAQHHWESMTPDGTLANSMDIANAIGFLVSDEASGVNGSIWNVDHGFTASADGRPLRYSVAKQFVS